MRFFNNLYVTFIRWIRDAARFDSVYWLILILGLQAMISVHILADGYFIADDFYDLIHAKQFGLTLDFLNRPLFDHWAPVHRFHDWVVLLTGLNWYLAGSIRIAFACGSTIILYILLRRIFIPGPGLVIIIAIFALNPLWFRSIQWMSAGILQVTAISFCLWTTERFITYATDRRCLVLLGMIMVYTLALASDVRPLIHSGLLALLYTSGLLIYKPAREVFRHVLSLYPAWILLFGMSLAIGYYCLENVITPIARPPWIDIAAFLEITFLRAFLTGIFFGIGFRFPNCMTPECAEAISGTTIGLAIIALGFVVVSIIRRWKVSFVWVSFLFVYTVMMAPIGMRRIPFFGLNIGIDYRYHVEILPYFVLTASFAFLVPRPWFGDLNPAKSTIIQSKKALALTLLSLIGLLAILSYRAADNVLPKWRAHDVKQFMNNVRQEIKQPKVLYDRLVPEAFLLIVSTGFNRASNIIPLITDLARFNGTDEMAYVIDDEGHVRQARLNNAREFNSGNAGKRICFSDANRELTLIPSVPGGKPPEYIVIKPHPDASGQMHVEVEVDGQWTHASHGQPMVPIPPSGVIRIPIREGFWTSPTAIRLKFEKDASGCFDSVLVGDPRPAQ